MKFEKLTPVLYSADVSRSIAYYTEVLGFEGKWLWDETPTFGGAFSEELNIFFCKDGQGHPGTWLYIDVKNIDEYYETLKKTGAKILEVPENKAWNMREMLVQDPDGHIIRFGQEIEECAED